ncbi:MAG: site-specific integrase [Bacteroidales bacterium]|jgi:site-specific recombinase XerD|nr:site-specific integrase [Bacteroidales bacterium]
MSIPQKKQPRGTIVSNLYGYTPAVLKEYADYWCIEYYVKHPVTHELFRRREKVTGYKTRYGVREARQLLRIAVDRLNLKLSQGWNPFFVHEDGRLLEPLHVVIEKFLKEKERELRPNTLRSYNSMIGKELLLWAQKNYPTITASTFSKNIAVRYMDFIAEKGKSNISYNNTKKTLSSFFCWCVEKCYAKENPFAGIKSKRKEEKKRILVTADVREQITAYLEKENNIGMQVALNLVYQSLLRPKEINEIRLKDVFLSEKYILVPGVVAKNHKERKATLSNATIELLQKLNIEKLPKDYFLLGGNQPGRSLIPHKQQADRNRINKNWVRLKKILKFPKEMQLYSLRDTGITDMLKSGIDDLTVMQHADHHSLEMTTQYAKHIDTGLVQKMNKLLPEF